MINNKYLLTTQNDCPYQHNQRNQTHLSRQRFIHDCLQQINKKVKVPPTGGTTRTRPNPCTSFPWNQLTYREYQCMTHLIQHKTYQQIGLEMGLTKRTVEFYIGNIKKKVNCRKKKILIELFSRVDCKTA